MGQERHELTCREFAELLRSREAHYPISDRYVSEVHDSPDKSGSDEREHMVIWFEANETKGSGPYSRNNPNKSARTCYVNLGNAASLLWIAEAMGIPGDTVQHAFDAAASAGHHRTACAKIREIIPWDEIQGRAEKLLAEAKDSRKLSSIIRRTFTSQQ